LVDPRVGNRLGTHFGSARAILTTPNERQLFEATAKPGFGDGIVPEGGRNPRR
jgi:hypothetical protein